MQRLVGGFAVVPFLVLLSCSDHGADTNESPRYIATSIRDLQTGYSADGMPFWIDPIELPDEYLSADTLRLVRWPSGELVSGAWRPMVGEIFGGRELLYFVADSSLANGWYAIQIRLPDWYYSLSGLGVTSDDGWTTQRGHVGSMPTALLAGDSPDLVLHLSEPVTFDEEYDLNSFLEYTIDGRAASCRYEDQDVYRIPPWPFHGGPLHCDTLPEGAVGELRIREGLFFGRGRSLVGRSGDSPPHWTFRQGEAISNEPTDAYFMRRAEDLAP